MSAIPFRHRAIAHLRDRLDVHTHVLPQSRIEDEQGNARFEAALPRGRASSTLSLSSLYTFTAAAVVAFIGQRPMSAAAHESYRIGAIALAIVGVFFFIAAMWSRRRSLIPLLVEIRGDAILDIDAVESARKASGDRAVWIFSAHGFTKDARAFAANVHVRCFAPHGGGIIECLPVAGHQEGRAA